MDLANGQSAGVLRVGLDVGAPPAEFFVEIIPERVIGFLPTGGRDIEAFPGAKLDTRRDNVQVVAVIDRQIMVLIRFQSGEGQLLEFDQNLLLLLLRGPILRPPRDHRATVAVFKLQRVAQLGDDLRVTS